MNFIEIYKNDDGYFIVERGCSCCEDTHLINRENIQQYIEQLEAELIKARAILANLKGLRDE